MKSPLNRVPLFLFLLIAMVGCRHSAGSSGIDTAFTYPGQFIVGDTYILRANERINGDISGIGTTLIIENGGQVTGNISLLASNLDLSGNVDGDVNLFAGTATIQDSAVVRGSVNQLLNQAVISPSARIFGEVNTYTFPNPPSENFGQSLTRLISWLRPSNWILLIASRLVVFILTTLLVMALFPEPTLRVVSKIRGNAAPAWGVGIICLITIPFIATLFIITICLSPIGIVLLILLLISYIWGWVGLSYLFGHHLLGWLGIEQNKEVVTVVGAVSLTILSMLLSLIPVVGFLISLMVSAIGLGGVVFSRFGTLTG